MRPRVTDAVNVIKFKIINKLLSQIRLLAQLALSLWTELLISFVKH